MGTIPAAAEVSPASSSSVMPYQCSVAAAPGAAFTPPPRLLAGGGVVGTPSMTVGAKLSASSTENVSSTASPSSKPALVRSSTVAVALPVVGPRSST